MNTSGNALRRTTRWVVRFLPAVAGLTLHCANGTAQPAGPTAPGPAARPGPRPAPLHTPRTQPVQDLIRRAHQARARKAYFAAAHFFRAAAARLQSDAAAAMEFKAYKAYLAAGRIVLALESLNRFCTLTSKPYERVYGARLIRRVSTRLIGEQKVRALYRRVAKNTVLAGLLAARLARILAAAGKAAAAKKVLTEASAGITAYGAAVTQGKVAATRVMGCLICLKGPYKRVCLSVLRGVLLASEVFGPPGAGKSLRVAVADVTGKAGPARSAGRLALGRRTIAIVGPVNPATARAAAGKAQKLGVPILTLTPDATVARMGPAVFQFLPRNERRAEALAKAVMSELHRGARVGVLAPATSAGRSLATSLAAHAAKAGGRVVTTVFYPARATHFASEIRKLQRARIEGLLAAVPARILDLLAPQLALKNMWPRRAAATGPAAPMRRRRRTRPLRRGPVVAATADGLTPRRLRQMRRYVEGVFVAPGFYPHPRDPHWGSFVKDYRRAYGKRPDIVAAYAYRAALTIRQVLDTGVNTRAGLIKGLKALKSAGRSGGLLFDAHGRLDRPPAVYRIIKGKPQSRPR